MNFGLLVPHLPRQLPQSFAHPDAGSPRDCAPLAPPPPASTLAVRWRRLKARLFAA
jgi:hypothetical protein